MIRRNSKKEWKIGFALLILITMLAATHRHHSSIQISQQELSDSRSKNH